MSRTARSRDAAQHWAHTWERGWIALDVDPIVELYCDDAVLSTEPFRDPYRGREGVREYVSRVFAEEDEPFAHFGLPIAEVGRAAVPWWASLREEGRDVSLAGVSMLRFDRAGLVLEQWDSWNRFPARRDPPTAWGPFL